jgi:gamma-glutamyltranspeptidase / glutathione hydrolase
MRDFQKPGRSATYAANGMCATSHPLAAATAVDILKSDGNAVDAAIAAAVLLGICEPQMTGIGGDCFVLFTPPGEDRVIALNGSGRAPAGLDPEDLRAAGHQTMPLAGATPVTVPGAVDAFCRLSADWGRMGLDRVLAPAIRYAEEGVPVAPRVASDWMRDGSLLTGRARDFYLFGGAPGTPGRIFRAPRQAEVLRRIAAEGRAGFYEGEVAEDMIASLRANGGVHTAEDFAATECSYSEPVRGPYRTSEIIEHPPNGQGAAAILLAGILAQFDIAGLDPFGAERVHVEAEATKLAYDARNRFIADPAHMDRLDHLLSPETARKLAGLIDPARAMENPTRLSEPVHKDTVYLTVVDRDGMKVSLIYSIFRAFGSGLASDKFGILFHNRGAGFNLTPGHPNEAGPGKRPMHTIIPGMLAEGGRVVLPFGVMGGAYQAAGHAHFVSNLVDFGMDPQEAIDAPRSFAWEGELQVERGYSDTVRAALAEKGHDVVVPDKPIGGAQAIRIDRERGVLVGGSDPRKDGCALGY